MRERFHADRVLSADERRRDLHRLTTDFGDFVDLLCKANQIVPSGVAEQRYADVRNRISRSYEAHRPFLKCFYVGDEPLLDMIGPETLDDWLLSDDGNMMERIHRFQVALHAYQQHLEVLEVARA